jgi:outer membrane lipoprotein-sorting protein
MLVKEKFYRLNLKTKIFFSIKIFLIYLLFINFAYADLQKNLINKLIETKTLSFDFKQKIANKVESGNCFIKYPLKMKCNYQNIKKKVIISNGKTVAVIKKKYKKIYRYSIKSTPLFTLLKKENILELIKNNEPSNINKNIVEFEFIGKKSKKIKIFFDRKTFVLSGWETIDAYSNSVSFIISYVKINHQIVDDFFKIPLEKNL